MKEVQAGTDVTVSEFGGEGTGMKSIKSIPWKNNEDVTMTLKGKRVGDKTWYVCAESNKRAMALYTSVSQQ